MRHFWLIVPLIVPLSGCATEPQIAPVAVVADTYCLTVKKRSWSVNDTQESINEAIRHNAAIDRACRAS